MTKDLTPISDRLQSVLDLIPADSYISGSEIAEPFARETGRW